MLVGAIISLYGNQGIAARPTNFMHQMLSILGLAMILFSFFWFDKTIPFPGLYALIPTIGTALIILYSAPGTISNRLLSNRLMVVMGLISYSAYLWHKPVFAFVNYYSIDKPSNILLAFLCLVIIALSYVSWRYIETPFRIKGRLKRNFILAYSAVFSTIVLTTGMVGHFNEGKIFYQSEEKWDVLGSRKKRNAYVWKNKKKFQLAPFENLPNRILIIGDSYSGDIINSLVEAGINKSTSISSFVIPAVCGNLYTKSDLSSYISAADRVTCDTIGWFTKPKLLALIDKATLVIMASAWKKWHLKFLSESHTRLKADFGEKFLVMGTKGYDMNLKLLAQLSSAERKVFFAPPSAAAIKINKEIKAQVGQDYSDIVEILCPQGRCRVFDRNLALISFDYEHLTKSGAVYLGNLMRAKSPYSSILKPVFSLTPTQ